MHEEFAGGMTFCYGSQRAKKRRTDGPPLKLLTNLCSQKAVSPEPRGFSGLILLASSKISFLHWS